MSSRQKKVGAASLLWIALIAIIAFIMFSPKNDHLEQKASISPERQDVSKQAIVSVDFSLPLYTKRSALVCPLAVVLDRRESYGLKAAIDAHLSIFGHDEAIARSGCQEWREGLSVFLTDKGKKQATEFEAKQMCGMVDFDQGLIFSCDLKNGTSAEPLVAQTNDASTSVDSGERPNTVATDDTPPKEVVLLMEKEEKLNSRCRGGSGDDPATTKACNEREVILSEIKAKNWCWGHEEQISADRVWERCRNK